MDQDAIPHGFDVDALRRVTGGDLALAWELLTMLVEELPKQRQSIVEASATGDMKQLETLSHSLAGGAAYCGALSLQRACIRLEQSLHDGETTFTTSLAAVLDQIDQLTETRNGTSSSC